MWLINTTSESLEMEEFIGEKKPKYAILSHRWEEEEISFKDMKNNRIVKSDGKLKKGWLKIKTFCELAASLGYHWTWVDTCCIDKSSSAELQESINSMFRWYRDSAMCMVYMSDAIHKSKDTFKRSQWFRRGWTLQELLAPSNIEFFDKEWISFGSKQQLCRIISERTSIPVAVLYDDTGTYLENCSIAQRLSWASERETTRAEDRAYSLLGMFGVHMPLLYGEGLSKAFERLQLQISQNYDTDETIFAWAGWQDRDSSISSVDRSGLGIRFHDSSSGLLAKDIADFRGCGNIQVTKYFRKSKPHSITSRGLQAELLLYSRSSFPAHIGESHFKWVYAGNMVIAPLNCSQEGMRKYLMLIPDIERDTYIRVGSFATGIIPHTEGEIREILIGKAPLTHKHPAVSDDFREHMNRMIKTLLNSDPHKVADLSVLQTILVSHTTDIGEEHIKILKTLLKSADMDKLMIQQHRIRAYLENRKEYG